MVQWKYFQFSVTLFSAGSFRFSQTCAGVAGEQLQNHCSGKHIITVFWNSFLGFGGDVVQPEGVGLGAWTGHSYPDSTVN